MKFSPIPVLVIGLLLIGFGFWAGTQISKPAPEAPQYPVSEDQDSREREEVYIYFVDPTDQYLFAENHPMILKGTPGERAHSIFDALVAGPVGEGQTSLPKGSELLAFYMDGDMAVLDLHPAIRDKHPGGSQAELHTLYALVNSLVINIPEIRRVKLLIAGQEKDTLAGHIDIRKPLTANMMIVR